MSRLDYKPITLVKKGMTSDYDLIYMQTQIYNVKSLYNLPQLKNDFINLKANVADLNPALVVKCIQGTEQDFIMLMNKAKEFLTNTYKGDEDSKNLLLQMFQECIFGYYVLTPLIVSPKVSDIKVYSWDHITCKANGKRYLTNLSFLSPDDYENWYKRILRIHRLGYGLEHALQHHTDTKGVSDFYLRIDLEQSNVVSTGHNNIHIRKMPKVKYTWDYLKENNMLDDDMIDYLKDRIVSGYGFLISGRGGSGKSTLLNNMIDFIPFDESVLVSQESDELYSNIHPQIQFEHTLEIGKRENKIEYTLDDELRLGLLQDIDNFVIGEIKGGEALYVFTTAMSTGARFFGTIHSNNAISSVRRLAQCAKYVSDYSVEALEEMLTSTPFSLIHMSNFSIDEIVEITGWDEADKRLMYKNVYKKKNNEVKPEPEIIDIAPNEISEPATKQIETAEKPSSVWNKKLLEDYNKEPQATAAFN